MSAAQPVLSPCTGVCELDGEGLCLGCRRSGAEIAGWMEFSPAQRDFLMQFVLPGREVRGPHD